VAVVPASDPTSSGEALGAVDVGSGATGSGAFTPGWTVVAVGSGADGSSVVWV